jgi:hypothetical protein
MSECKHGIAADCELCAEEDRQHDEAMAAIAKSE